MAWEAVDAFVPRRVKGVSPIVYAFPLTAKECCNGVLNVPPRLQHLFTVGLEDIYESIHNDNVRTQEEKVRAREARAPGAKGACLAQPRTQETTLPPDAAKFAYNYRGGTAAAPDVSHCPCGLGKPSITHILSCRYLRGRFARHDVIVNVLVDMLRVVGVVASAEVMVLEDSQKRMDVVLTLPTGRVWIDVSVVNPLIATYLTDSSPLVTREKQKVGKWGNLARTQRVRFVPFIVSTFGGLGPKALEFLGFIASEAFQKGLITTSTSMEHAVGQYRAGLAQRVGVAVAHANSCLVSEVRARAVNPRFKTGPLYSALQARGRKQTRGGAIPRVYVGKRGASSRVDWPKSACGLRAGGGRAKAASARRPFDSAPHPPAPVGASDSATGGGSASGDVGQSDARAAGSDSGLGVGA